MSIEDEIKMKLERTFTPKEVIDWEPGYKSPVEIIYGDIKTYFEDDVYKAIQHYDINVDKEELIKALNYDRYQYDAGYIDGHNSALKEISTIIDEYVDLIQYHTDPVKESKLVALMELSDYINYKINRM